MGRPRKIKDIKEQQFPKLLVDAFAKLLESKWGEKEYIAYTECAKSFLGNRFEDKLEQGRLVVLLSRSPEDKVKKEQESV